MSIHSNPICNGCRKPIIEGAPAVGQCFYDGSKFFHMHCFIQSTNGEKPNQLIAVVPISGERLDAFIEENNMGCTVEMGLPEAKRIAETYAIATELKSARSDIRELRRMLAFAYSGSNLYVDDRELQDSRFPSIDFVRDTVTDIANKITQRGMDQLAHAQSQCHHEIGDNNVCKKCFKVMP